MFSPLLTCIFVISLCCSPHIKADQEEDAFVALYGTNNETSGVWQALRDISSDEQKMRTLCEQAHSLTGAPATDRIDHIAYDVKTLSFDKNRPSIILDVVSYNVTRLPPFELPRKRMFYFTKGTKPDCVFYLIPWRRIVRIGLHFCGITVPS